MDAPLLRIYIVDEHDRVRRALADRLGRSPSVEVVGGSAAAGSAIEAVRSGLADVVLVEIKRSDGLGLDLVRQLAALPGRPRVLVLTSYPTEWEEAAAYRAGAAAYLLKDLDPELLLRQILASPG